MIEAIKNDPDLLPEAKEHLMNQYGLLLRIQSRTPAPQRILTHLDPPEREYEELTQAALDEVSEPPVILAESPARSKRQK